MGLGEDGAQKTGSYRVPRYLDRAATKATRPTWEGLKARQRLLTASGSADNPRSGKDRAPGLPAKSSAAQAPH